MILERSADQGPEPAHADQTKVRIILARVEEVLRMRLGAQRPAQFQRTVRIRKHLLEKVWVLGREHPMGCSPRARVQGHDPKKARSLGFAELGAFNQTEVLRTVAPAVVRHDLRYKRTVGAVVHRRTYPTKVPKPSGRLTARREHRRP